MTPRLSHIGIELSKKKPGERLARFAPFLHFA